MDSKEHAKELSDRIESLGKHSYICQADVAIGNR